MRPWFCGLQYDGRAGCALNCEKCYLSTRFLSNSPTVRACSIILRAHYSGVTTNCYIVRWWGWAKDEREAMSAQNIWLKNCVPHNGFTASLEIEISRRPLIKALSFIEGEG